MAITISKHKNPYGKVKIFYRVKDNGEYIQDFRLKSTALKFANKRRKIQRNQNRRKTKLTGGKR